MELPITICPKLVNPGMSNAEYSHCLAATYFKGQRLVAYGSSNHVIITSGSLSIITSLERHKKGTVVTAVSWAQSSGKLSSCGSDNKIFIWEPTQSEQWKFSQEIEVDSPVVCFSWSNCDRKFCVCTNKTVTIYQIDDEPDPQTGLKPIKSIWIDMIKATFCSYSRDSRFILVLPEKSNDILIYHKKENSRKAHSRISLRQTSPVKTVRWRTSDNVHERSCFMTLGKDMVVRIWSETDEKEKLMFNVVAAIPENYRTIFVAFITNASSIAIHNPNTFNKSNLDTYAYGHGHFQMFDKDIRDASVPDRNELEHNRFWFLTYDNQNVIIWELKGVSSSVRRTPEIVRLYSFKPGFSFNEISHFIATCRLKNDFSHCPKNNYDIHSLSFIIQDKEKKIITSTDYYFVPNGLSRNQMSILHGHNNDITLIRVNRNYQLMVSIDKDGCPFIWEFNDTDVYDPSVLVTFICQLDVKLLAADWMSTSSKCLIGFDGEKLYTFIEYNNDNLKFYKKYEEFETNLKEFKDEFKKFKVICEFNGGILFYTLFTHDLFIMYFYQDKVEELKHIHSNETFCHIAPIYVTRLLPYPGATICFVATKHEIYCATLNYCYLDSKNRGNLISYKKVLTIESDDIYKIAVCHPGFLFIVCLKNIYISWRACSSTGNFVIIQTIPIDFKDFTDIKIASLATGLFAISTKGKIYLYYPRRESNTYLKSNLKWELISSFEVPQVGAIEWTLEGILVYSSGNQIFAFTKFMDTFFLDVQKCKLPTFHYTLSNLCKMIPDFHPSNIIPLLISGRFSLLINMFKYLNDNLDKPNLRRFDCNHILNIPNDDENDPLLSDSLIQEITQGLIKKLQEINISSSEYTETEKETLIYILEKFPEIVKISKDILDTKGLIVVRALTLSKDHTIPFDLILLASQSKEQKQLFSYVDFSSWERVCNSGVIFWMKDLTQINNAVVSLAVSVFEKKKFLSIILLTLTQRFKVLQTLFHKINDDTRAEFFVRDFSTVKNRKFAEKNGYSALRKQDYHIAAAMFCLANKYDIAMRILTNDLNDISLSFFALRNIISRSLIQNGIEQFFLPKAKIRDDKAAILFFNLFLHPELTFDYSERSQQYCPNNYYESSNYFCDMRFCIVKTLNPSDGIKTNLTLSYILSGNMFLATQFLKDFDTFVLHEDKVNLTPINSIMSMPKIHSVFNFQVKENDIDERKNNLGNINERFNSDEFESEEEEESEEEKENKLKSFTFGFTSKLIESDYDDTFDSYESDSEIEQPPPSIPSKSVNLIAKPIVLKDFVANSYHLESDSCEIKTDTCDCNFENDNITHSRWINIITIFNVAINRLENYLETQENFSIINQSITLRIISEIKETGKHVESMYNQIHDYLIRTCKRRCYIFRRLLLLSSSTDKMQYICELCKSLSSIPYQITSLNFTPQQISQITQTLQALMRCVNQKFVELNDKRAFIISSIITGIYVVALYNHDKKLMLLILNLDLKKLQTFPKEMFEHIEIHVAKYNKITYNAPRITYDQNYFSFLSKEEVETFKLGEKSNPQYFGEFISSLIDFLLIDNVLINLNDIRDKISENLTQNLLVFMNKIRNIYLQIFMYSALRFPVSLKIESLENIVSSEKILNDIFIQLISHNDRLKIIPSFCNNLINKFSYKKIPTFTKVSRRAYLQKTKEFKNYKMPIWSICLNKECTTLMVATKSGLIPIQNPINIETEPEEEDNESLLINFVDNANINDTILKEEEEANELQDELQDESYTKIQYYESDFPRYLSPHPNENYVLVGGTKGNVYICGFDNITRQHHYDIPNNAECNGVEFSDDGSSFAALNGRYVSLFNTERKRPFTNFDTFSDKVTGIKFFMGTGKFLTQQIESSECKANICVWDSLLPNYCAMVSSLKLSQKYGHPQCMSYSPKFSQIYVGTTHGSLITIDTRQFEIVSQWKVYDSKKCSVMSIDIDEKRGLLSTGTSTGTLKLWNIETSQILSRHKGHKSRKGSITKIIMQNDTIFTSSIDGFIYRIPINFA